MLNGPRNGEPVEAWNERRIIVDKRVATILQNAVSSPEQIEIVYSILDGRCKLFGAVPTAGTMIPRQL